MIKTIPVKEGVRLDWLADKETSSSENFKRTLKVESMYILTDHI